MKKKFLFFLILLIFIFIIFVFYQGINKTSIYIPDNQTNIKINNFSANDLISGNQIELKDFISKEKLTIINIWASWCVPCRAEHHYLMKMKKEYKIQLIGLNYKDNKSNAKSFLDEFGNPFYKIFQDIDGTLSIEMGAYGVPETIIIDSNFQIVKKIIGPLTQKDVVNLNKLLK